MVFQPLDWDLPHPIGIAQLRPHLLFTDQLHDDRSECVIPTNQDSGIWTKDTVEIWVPHLHKDGRITDLGRHFP